MGAVYTASFDNVSVGTAGQDIFELTSGSANSVKIRRLRLTTAKTTTENVRINIKRVTGSPTPGSGGSAVTEQPLSKTYATNTAAVVRNNTTRITGGTSEPLYSEFWNILVPFEWVPNDEKGQGELAASEHFVVGIEGTAVAVNMSGWLEWEEVG